MHSNRREFFQFLAASTVLTPSMRALAQQLAVSHDQPGVIMSAKEALQVMDFEEAARRALPPAHWWYMASGVDDDLTLRANVEAYRHIGLKPRRLVDVSKPDAEGAQRFARLLISEIKLYHEAQVDEGRRARDLRQRLHPHIERARQLYEERVPSDLRARTDYFEQELVRTLADGDPILLGQAS